MPSTFTGNTGIELIADGEQSGLWGQTTNDNLVIVDRALNGSINISLSGTTHTLTTADGVLSDGQFAVLVFTGSPSGTNTVAIAPNTAQKTYFVTNSTAQTVVLSQGSGATVSVPAGRSRIVFTNGAGAGAAVFDITNTLSGTMSQQNATAVNIDGGTIDGAVIGAASAAAATFTNVTANGTINLAGATVSNGGSVTTIDINGGTIDGTVIGGTTPAAISGTVGTFSGDATIHGATVGRGGGAISTNTAVGSGALSSNTTGNQNTANGVSALLNNTTGGSNTANGVAALRNNTTGDSNTANGVSALQFNTTGFDNTANGRSALRSNTTGFNNTATGRLALFDNTEGSNNIGIGLNAGRSTSPRTITTQSNEICIGNNDHTGAFIKIGFTVTSDARDKAELAPIPHGLDFVNALQPTEYQFKAGGRGGEADGIRRYGFLAQDVLAAEGDTPVIVNNDDPDSLKMTHDYLIPVLVNAVKELTAQVNDLKAEVAALKGQ